MYERFRHHTICPSFCIWCDISLSLYSYLVEQQASIDAERSQDMAKNTRRQNRLRIKSMESSLHDKSTQVCFVHVNYHIISTSIMYVI